MPLYPSSAVLTALNVPLSLEERVIAIIWVNPSFFSFSRTSVMSAISGSDDLGISDSRFSYT